MRPCTAVVLIGLAAGIGACGSILEQAPETGSGIDQLKRSPCACVGIEQYYPPGWRQAARRRLRG